MKRGKPEETTRALVNAAVKVAVEACMKGIDEKIEAAVNLGVTVGATAGAEAGAAAALKAAERMRRNARKQEHDWKLYNTKLLLRNYRRLNEYHQNAVFDEDTAAAADESFEEIMRSMSGRGTDEEVLVESIRRNYIATKIIMTHVNKMLDCYKVMCERSARAEDARRWRVLDGLYLADSYTTAEEIARQEGIDKRTVYRDIDACADDLATLFFGVGGLADRI